MDIGREKLTLSTMALLDRAQLRRLEEKYVTRTIKCVPDKFTELCHMHLAFLLDLSDDKLEMLLSSQDEHRKKKPSLVAVSVFKKKEKPQTDLFGAPLTDEGVCLMVPLMNFLKLDKNICKEGLFRKPGNKNRMNTLRELLVTHGPAVCIDHEVYSPYDVACVLKEFLRELPEPLLTVRHMEAHRQVLALGKHAKLPEEISRYDHKKLSALQLLMLLLPAPAQKLTMQLLKLLQRIANCPETKMTPSTLGTIFAPIFFIDRCLEPSGLCLQISQMAPAVSFMIEKAHDLVHAPKELIIDLANYWNAPTSEFVSETVQTKKSLSGRTLNTNVCYIDRELSRCDDVASNTQAELANLFAHVQSLPNTPNNIRLKRQILKSTASPMLYVKNHSQSKSITASIKKRLPTLGRSKNKQDDESKFSDSNEDTKLSEEYGVMSYKCTEKVAVVHCAQVEQKYLQPLRQKLDFYSLHHANVTPSMSQLLESPACITQQNNQQGSSRSRCKGQHTPVNPENSSDSECTPPKQECKVTETCHGVKLCRKYRIPSYHEFSSKTCLRELNDLSTFTSTPKIKDRIRSSSASPRYRVGLSPKNAFVQSENEIDYLPCHTAKRITVPLTPNRDNNHTARAQSRSCRTPWIPAKTRVSPQIAHNKLETSI